MTTLPEFAMEFEMATIEHLGLKLYASMPRVIGELVSNAWDAEAHSVRISLPDTAITPESEVVVLDDGHGMDPTEVQEAYLRIGLNRRSATNSEVSKNGIRKLMGRKGLGKLAVFGIADELEIRTVNGGTAVCLKLNYKEMENCPPGVPYKPRLMGERSGPTEDPNGTEVRVRGLRRRYKIAPDTVIRELARRFSVIGDDFLVEVNRRRIAASDRRLRDQCRKTWDTIDLPGAGAVDEPNGWRVSGWVGLAGNSSQVERGVDIFARGKAVEIETMFGLGTTHIQYARAYILGEIHADFLDAEEDNVSTARDSVLWDTEAGQRLRDWGQKALKFVFQKWLELQRDEKQNRIVKVAGFDDWLGTRTKREQRVAKKLLKAIVEDEKIEVDSAAPLLEIIKSNVEFQAFQELVDELEETGTDVATLLRLFEEWRVIEAREHLKLSDGRLDAFEKLAKYIQEGALEVQQIQPLFEKNGWLVEPAWGEVTGQTRYSELLRKHCVEPKELPEVDRRMDILGYTPSDTLYVVELKRPEKVLSRKDLEQIEAYVDWARSTLLSSSENALLSVRGRLVVGRMPSNAALQQKVTRLAGSDIRVETYDDLLRKAETYCGEVERRLKKVAPEYSRSARRSRPGRAKKGGKTSRGS